LPVNLLGRAVDQNTTIGKRIAAIIHILEVAVVHFDTVKDRVGRRRVGQEDPMVRSFEAKTANDPVLDVAQLDAGADALN